MDELNRLKAELTALDGQIDELLASNELTDQQRADHDAFVARREKLMDSIGREKDKLARAAERAELERDARAVEERTARAVQPGRNRLTTVDAPRPADVPAEREAAATATVFAEFKRYGPVKNFVGERRTSAGRFTAEERAFRFGNWALYQLSRQMPGKFNFHKAVDFVQRNMATAVTSKDASGYSNLIPEEFGQDLIDLRERRGVIRRLFKNQPMTSDTRTDPRRQGGLTAYFPGEGGAGTESNKTWDNVRLTAKDLMVLTRYTNQINADAVINVGDDLASEIAYAFADKEDKCGLIGDGSSTYGGIVGATTALTNVSSAAGLVTQGTSNTWAAQVLGDFDAVVGKLPQYADTDRACWVCHRTYYYTVIEKLIQASGGVPAYEVREGNRRPRPMFKGYPVEFSQVMPSATATTGITVLLGDFSLGASFGDRQMDDIAFSEHATIGTENVFERNQIAVRGTERMDINVHDVGDSTNPGPIVALKTG